MSNRILERIRDGRDRSAGPRWLAVAALAAWPVFAQEPASFSTDAGFRVLALDFRGYGDSVGPKQQDPIGAPLHLDVLGAVRYLRAAGATSVAVVGASLGGMAGGDAARQASPGEIDRLVFLASGTSLQEGTPAPISIRSLFIVAREDADGEGTLRLPGIRAEYERAAEPKRLVVIEGSAHAQALFATQDAEGVLAEIVEFLSAP